MEGTKTIEWVCVECGQGEWDACELTMILDENAEELADENKPMLCPVSKDRKAVWDIAS